MSDSLHTVTLQFSLKQRVRVKDINRTGVVTGITIDGEGLTYRVVYWDNSQRRSEWLFDFEIEEL